MPARQPCDTNCILLRKTPFQESSLVISAITAGYGRVDFLLKGARTVGKRKFPEAELFREFHVIFREAKNADGLASIIECEPVAQHDAIAEKTEHYMAACSCAAFYLKNTKPMLPVPESYQAFRTMLLRMEKEKEIEPWASLARYVLLNENGFVPASPQADRLLKLALDPDMIPPEDHNSFWNRFKNWIDNLCLWSGIEK